MFFPPILQLKSEIGTPYESLSLPIYGVNFYLLFSISTAFYLFSKLLFYYSLEPRTKSAFIKAWLTYTGKVFPVGVASTVSL